MSDAATLLEEARLLELRLWGLAVRAARIHRRLNSADSEARFIHAVALQTKAQKRYARRYYAFSDKAE